MYLQHTRHGEFLAKERTWVTVVIGISADLAIAFPGDWWTVTAVIGASSVGVIARSLWNEHTAAEINNKSYKLIWTLEDSISLAQDAIKIIDTMLTGGKIPAAEIPQISVLLSKIHTIKTGLVDARRGHK